jgi:hypothetical protein
MKRPHHEVASHLTRTWRRCCSVPNLRRPETSDVVTKCCDMRDSPWLDAAASTARTPRSGRQASHRAAGRGSAGISGRCRLRCGPSQRGSRGPCERWLRGVASSEDVDALQRILTPDFLFITSSGEVGDRQELLRSYGAREVSLRAFTSENVRVRFHGNVDILTADITKEGEYLTGPRAGAVFTGRYRFTRVYACGSGGWQLVSTHESQLGM